MRQTDDFMHASLHPRRRPLQPSFRPPARVEQSRPILVGGTQRIIINKLAYASVADDHRNRIFKQAWCRAGISRTEDGVMAAKYTITPADGR